MDRAKPQAPRRHDSRWNLTTSHSVEVNAQSSNFPPTPQPCYHGNRRAPLRWGLSGMTYSSALYLMSYYENKKITRGFVISFWDMKRVQWFPQSEAQGLKRGPSDRTAGSSVRQFKHNFHTEHRTIIKEAFTFSRQHSMTLTLSSVLHFLLNSTSRRVGRLYLRETLIFSLTTLTGAAS